MGAREQTRNKHVGHAGPGGQYAAVPKTEPVKKTNTLSGDPFDPIRDLTPKPTGHFIEKMTKLGLDPRDVIATIKDPDFCYQSGPKSKYPGQWRLAGNGVCVMAEALHDKGILQLRTVIIDGEMTPPRPDQLDTPEGRDYARRYYAGLNRRGTL